MFRVGLLIRALPSILLELARLMWHAGRTGDRTLALNATIWMASTVALLYFTTQALSSAVRGGQVQLTGAVMVASVPVTMWLGGQIVLGLLRILARCWHSLTGEPAGASR